MTQEPASPPIFGRRQPVHGPSPDAGAEFPVACGNAAAHRGTLIAQFSARAPRRAAWAICRWKPAIAGLFGRAVFVDQATTIPLDEITASLTSERKENLLALLRTLIAANPETVAARMVSHHVSSG